MDKLGTRETRSSGHVEKIAKNELKVDSELLYHGQWRIYQLNGVLNYILLYLTGTTINLMSMN